MIGVFYQFGSEIEIFENAKAINKKAGFIDSRPEIKNPGVRKELPGFYSTKG